MKYIYFSHLGRVKGRWYLQNILSVVVNMFPFSPFHLGLVLGRKVIPLPEEKQYREDSTCYNTTSVDPQTEKNVFKIYLQSISYHDMSTCQPLIWPHLIDCSSKALAIYNLVKISSLMFQMDTSVCSAAMCCEHMCVLCFPTLTLLKLFSHM